ncbi:MAG: IclR family transcriptional regulator [Mesorhizobium sp.]
MGTVTKALGLIDLLKDAAQPLGLTEIARAADFDKATTRRLLLELVENGYVEQDPDSRTYSLGPALQVLGKIREKRFPLSRIVEPIVRDLAEETGETVHAAEYCAGELASICIEESLKANRVILDMGVKLPLHATASGFAFLAASPDSFVEKVSSRMLARFTAKTPMDPSTLQRIVRETRERGYSRSDQSFEDEVSSVAAAIRGPGGKPAGTIAIAMPSSRMTEPIAAAYGRLVGDSAALAASRLFGGKNPRSVPFMRKAS